MLFSNFIFFNPATVVHNAIRGDVLSQFAPLAANKFGVWLYFIGGFHWSWTLFGLAIIAAFFLAMVGVVVFAGNRELMKKGIGPAFAFLIVTSVVAARANDGNKPTPPPPPIRISDIKITSFKCDHTGLAISWIHGTNVTYGVDTFVIQRKTRQIPSRTGWSANWEDFDTTMQTNYLNATPFHAQDNRFRVIVRKEQDK